jgi:hypothetical protein
MGQDFSFSTKSAPFKAKWMAPTPPGDYKPPRMVEVKRPVAYCKSSRYVPSTFYAHGPALKNKVVVKNVDVMRDLCAGKQSGVIGIAGVKKTGACGLPDFKWKVSWKTSEIVGKTKAKYVLPPAYQWCDQAACPKGALDVTGKAKPWDPAKMGAAGCM